MIIYTVMSNSFLGASTTTSDISTETTLKKVETVLIAGIPITGTTDINLIEIDGTAINTGNGVHGGSQRVAIASDNSDLPIKNGAAGDIAISATQLPASLGQTTMANSLAVAIASDQDVLASETTLAAQSAKLPATLGQKTMAASMAVTMASDQTPIDISNTYDNQLFASDKQVIYKETIRAALVVDTNWATVDTVNNTYDQSTGYLIIGDTFTNWFPIDLASDYITFEGHYRFPTALEGNAQMDIGFNAFRLNLSFQVTAGGALIIKYQSTGVGGYNINVASANWNIDKADGTGNLPLIDPLSVYNSWRIIFNFSGFIEYSIFNPTTFMWQPVHRASLNNVQTNVGWIDEGGVRARFGESGGDCELAWFSIYAHKERFENINTLCGNPIDLGNGIVNTGTQRIAIASNGNNVRIDGPINPFNSLHTESESPLVQLDATYGILNSDVDTSIGPSGTVDTLDQTWRCQTGINAAGSASVLSRRVARYMPGQGMKSRFTSIYTTGVANSFQAAGLFSQTNSLSIGFDGLDFGVLHRHSGRIEIQKVVITAFSTVAANVRFTLDGVNHDIALSAGGTIPIDANEIETDAVFDTGDVECFAIDDALFFVFRTAGNKTGTMSYTDIGGTNMTVSAFTEITQGASTTDDWTTQANWNRDVLDGSGNSTNPSGDTLDPTKFNIWAIDFEYLGAGRIIYYKEMSDGKINPIHENIMTNTNTVTNLPPSPNMEIGIQSINIGNTTNLTVRSGSLFAGVSGKFTPPRNPSSVGAINVDVGTTEEAVFIIRCGGIFNNTINHRELLFEDIGIATTGFAKAVLACVRLNPTITGNTNFDYYDEGESCIDIDTQTGLLTSGGTILFQTFLGSSDSVIHDMSKLKIRVRPRDIISFSANATSGAAGEVSMSVSLFEV